jgi:hypothetical protein
LEEAAGPPSPLAQAKEVLVLLAWVRRRVWQNGMVRFALNKRWLEEQGVPDMNAMAALAARKIQRSLTAWTQRSGVKAVWIDLRYGAWAPR